MNILIDTNVILDVLLCRVPHNVESGKIIALSEKGKLNGFVSASSITDIYYVTRKKLNDEKATIDTLKKLLSILSVADVLSGNIYEILELDWEDFEDCLQYSVGKSVLADYIITRNAKDFSKSSIPVLTPQEFIEDLQS
jgi:predicted nucleic acid-binding protein